MSEPSDEVVILRKMLDIHEQSTRMLKDAGIELPRTDQKELAKLERQLAKGKGG